LRRHVLEPLLARCVDKEHRGFLVDFDDRWQSVGPHDESLEHATRTTIAFALLNRTMPGEGCERLARHGCAFLQEAMWDGRYGGFFARVDRSGWPLWDGLKHPHAVTYAALAFQLTEPLLPSGEAGFWARPALGWLDDAAWDDRDGGYWVRIVATMSAMPHGPGWQRPTDETFSGFRRFQRNQHAGRRHRDARILR
jgi:hypothetical protein